MKKQLISSVLFIALLAMGCSQSNKNDTELVRKVEELQKRADSLQKQSDQTLLKARIANDLVFADPLHRFFLGDEFWENPVDVAQAECAKRCSRNLQQANAACLKITDEAQRLKCLQDASNSASNCQTQCSRL